MLQPTKYFSEGAMLPLLGVLDQNTHIRNLNLAETAMQDSRLRFSGNGNSNARVLNFILRKNTSIEELNLSNTGLDDNGLKELAEAIRVNSTLKTLNISGNYFGNSSPCFFSLFHSCEGLTGARALVDALSGNTSLITVDISRNALSYDVLFQDHTLTRICVDSYHMSHYSAHVSVHIYDKRTYD
jgi:Leucine-rich repeat (LRR) protein